MRKWWILLYLLAVCNIHAQYNSHTIDGFVTDRVTGKPLSEVNIFVSGTSYGHVSDRIGYFEIRNLPEGTYKLTFSLIGYESLSILIELTGSEVTQQEIKLTPRIYSTETIEIKAKTKIDESTILKKFKKLFFGQSDFADSCRILNEGSIKISSISDQKVQIECDSVLIIRNNALGYFIRGNIKATLLDLSTSELKINFEPDFEEICPIDLKQDSFWQENRKAAFKGTLRHFLSSLYRNNLNKDGYQLFIRRPLKNNQLEKVEDIKNITCTDNQGRLVLKADEIIIKYGLDISLIQLRTPSVIINNDGKICGETEVYITGALSERNLSKQLPGNYYPQLKISINRGNIHDQIELFLDSIKYMHAPRYESLKDSVKLLSFKHPDDVVLQLKYAALLERCCITSAESILRAIIRKDTLCSEAYHMLGLIKAKEYGDFKGSIKEIIDEYEQETLRSRMAWSGGYVNIPQNEKHVFKYTAFNEEILEESVGLLSKAISCNPGIDDYYMALAKLFEDSGNYNSASEVIRKLLMRNIENKDAHLLSGLLHFRNKNYRESKREFDIALTYMDASEKDDFIYNSAAMLLEPVIGNKYASMNEITLSETIKKFWNTADPLLLTSYNERLLEHYARTAHAQIRFGTKSGNMPGWKSERGEVLIRYGFPKEVVRYRPVNTINQKNMMELKSKTDVWFYDDMIFSFYDPFLSDEFRLSSGNETKIKSQYAIDSKMFTDNLKKSEFERYTFVPEGVHLNFSFNTYQFRDLSDRKSGNTEIFGALAACGYDKDDFRKDLHLWGLSIYDSKFNLLYSLIDSLSASNQENILLSSENNDVIFVKSYKSKPTSLKIASEVLREPNKGSFSSHTQTELRDYNSEHSLMLSDIIISPKVVFGSGSSTAINRNGIWILPKPGQIYTSKDTVHIYYEIYNLSADSLGINDYEQEIKISSKSGDGDYLPGKLVNGIIDFFMSAEDEKNIQTRARMVSHSRNHQSCFSTNFSGLIPGEYVFTISIKDNISGQTAERKTEFTIIY